MCCTSLLYPRSKATLPSAALPGCTPPWYQAASDPQAERACIINRVEHDSAADGRPDPEAQVGRALRQLRLSRNWSQEEVAVRMTVYGYDFHQTTIAKIEGAQRPLRVRELADFAALYGVEVQDLVHPPTGSLLEIEQEITEVTAKLTTARTVLAAAAQRLASSRQAVSAAEAGRQAALAEVAVLEGRLASLSADRQKAERESPLPQGSDGAERNTPAPMATSTAANTGPTVLRRLLGAQLKRLREASGISREEAGYAIRASGSKISRYELGRAGARERDVADLLTLYGVEDENQRQKLLELARRANTPGWWHDYSDILPDWFGTYIGLEMIATQMWVYEVQFVPELLRTEDYLRALAVTPRDQEEVATEEIERRVRLGMARKDKFFDRSNATNLRVVLDEAVLRRQVGGPAVMHDQLKHLAEIAEQPNITVQVLSAQAAFAGQGSFSILLFSESELPDIVYIEQLTSALYLDKPEDVNVYRRLIQQLSTQALTPQKTTQFLRKLLQ
jgi:transcriptional regulator with XRE-family HTH domain